MLATLLNFAETASRNWNFGGHVVAVPFEESRGYWDYADTTYEPWLFDRAEVWWMLASMTGDARWSSQAQSDLAYYESHLDARGIFTNKRGEDDTKYSYVHTWSTNRPKQTAAFDATVAGFPNVPNPGSSALWTEREVWVALNAASSYHEVTGSPTALARAQAMLDQWDIMCAGRGAPLVTYTRHEGGGPGGTQPTDLVTSPWMSALYFQAARRLADRMPSVAPQVHRQASDYFDWLDVAAHRGFYPGEQAHPQYAGMIFPAYLAGGTLIGDAGPGFGNAEHAIDVAGFLAFTIRAKAAMGRPTASVQVRLDQMLATAQLAFDDATRTTNYLPKYRLAPPRKFNWWARGVHELWVNGMLP